MNVMRMKLDSRLRGIGMAGFDFEREIPPRLRRNFLRNRWILMIREFQPRKWEIILVDPEADEDDKIKKVD